MDVYEPRMRHLSRFYSVCARLVRKPRRTFRELGSDGSFNNQEFETKNLLGSSSQIL